MLYNRVSLVALSAALFWVAPVAAHQATPPANDTGQTNAGAPTAMDDSSQTRADAISGRASAGDDGTDVVVTGSRIQRPNATAAAPITSVTAQDIRAQAPINVEEVLNRLPQVAPDSQQNYQDSDGRQRIKLRSLGFERTLVLLDGKRLGTINGEDANIIPVSLIERVDVLTGGASAVYGSDAVAGVVNFILKPDFKGIRLDANYNFYNHENASNIVTQQARATAFPVEQGTTNDGGRADLSLTAGTALFDDALHISGFIDYRHADLLPYSSRATSACQLLQTTKDGPLSCSLSSYSTSGYISPRSGANSGTAYVNNPNGTRTFIPYGIGAGNAANPYDGLSYQRQDNRLNAGGFVTLKLAPEFELYGSGLWFRDKSINRFPNRIFSYTAYGSSPYQVNCNNPYLSSQQATTLCGAAAGTAALVPLEVRYRLNSPFIEDTYVNSGVRATGGIRGKIGEAWSYDVGGVYARNQQDYLPAQLPDFTRVNNTLNVVNVNGVPTCAAKVNGTDPACVPFDAFSANNGNPAVVNYIYGANAFEKQTTVGQLYDVLANVSADLGKYGITSPFAEDGLAFALGVEYREDRQTSTANAAFYNDNGGSDSDLRQHVWEGDVELQVPLVQHKRFADLLQANGAFRVSRYNTNPDTFTTWKLEGVYAPVSDITFRVSFNKAQRAPSVVEAYQASNISYGKQGGSENDFCAPTAVINPATGTPATDAQGNIVYGAPIASRAVCRATGLSDALYGSKTLLCPNNQCTTRSGGFTATPETAYTQTYGLVLKPRFLKGLVFSVDRYRIKIDNSIGYNGYDYFQNGCLRSSGDPFFCSAIVRAADGTLYAAAAGNPTSGFIREGTTNYYFSIARGWDFQGDYTQKLGSIGAVNFEFNGSLTTFAGGQDSPIEPLRNCAGYYGNGCGQLLPKWSHGLRTTYTVPDGTFNASFNWRYIGTLTNANNSSDPAISGVSADNPTPAQTTFYRIAPASYFDLALTFNIAKRYSLRLIANNLFDKDPPILPNSYTYSLARSNTIPQRYDSLGRNIAIAVTTSF